MNSGGESNARSLQPPHEVWGLKGQTMTTKFILPTLAALSILVAAVSPATAGKPDPGCSAGPGQVALDQNWTMSAYGLPTNTTVNLITTYPSGAMLTGPVSVAADGTFSMTSSSATGWPPEQTGAYTYQFVGKVKWPQGSFTQSYATCSVSVS